MPESAVTNTAPQKSIVNGVRRVSLRCEAEMGSRCIGLCSSLLTVMERPPLGCHAAVSELSFLCRKRER